MLFELKDISFRYSDGTLGLDAVSGQIEAGERLAIVGANGSGKSTLLKALDALIEPSSGSILFDGQPLNEKSLREERFQQEFRSRVGFVFQDSDAQLFNATVREELAFGPAQLGLPMEVVDQRVGDTLSHLGIEYLADRAPFRLSGGEKRKVAIASVLTMNPDVILFDEPFVALDPRTQAWLFATLGELHAAGKTTIIATHFIQTLPQVADRAIVLSEDHRLLASMPIGNLMTDPVLLARACLAATI